MVGEFCVDEVNEEVVFVEVDFCFVFEEFLDVFIDYNRLIVFEFVGMGLLSVFMVE